MPFIGCTWLQTADGVPCLRPRASGNGDPASVIGQAVLKRVAGGSTDGLPIKSGGCLGNPRSRKPVRSIAGVPSCCSECDRIGPGAGFAAGAVGPDPPLISGIGKEPAYCSVCGWERAARYCIPGAIWRASLHRITLGSIDRVPAKSGRIICDIGGGRPGRCIAYRRCSNNGIN